LDKVDVLKAGLGSGSFNTDTPPELNRVEENTF